MNYFVELYCVVRDSQSDVTPVLNHIIPNSHFSCSYIIYFGTAFFYFAQWRVTVVKLPLKLIMVGYYNTFSCWYLGEPADWFQKLSLVTDLLSAQEWCHSISNRMLGGCQKYSRQTLAQTLIKLLLLLLLLLHLLPLLLKCSATMMMMILRMEAEEALRERTGPKSTQNTMQFLAYWTSSFNF